MDREGFVEHEATRIACKDMEQMEVVFAELFSRETLHQQADYTKTMEARSDDAHTVGIARSIIQGSHSNKYSVSSALIMTRIVSFCSFKKAVRLLGKEMFVSDYAMNKQNNKAWLFFLTYSHNCVRQKIAYGSARV